MSDTVTPAAGPRLEILSEDECLLLLTREPVGRIGLTSSALPVVLPVNFAVVDHAVVFATEPGLKLDAARQHTVACLQVDGFDVFGHTGWSVLATGRLREITDQGRIDEAKDLALSPWAIARPQFYVELNIELLSGRRINRY